MTTEPKRIGGKGKIAEVMAHRKALGLPVGRPRGVPNKLTRHVREAVLRVYEELGGHEGFARWARKHPTQFYSLMVKLAPKEREANALGSGISIVVHGVDTLRPVIDVTAEDGDTDPA